MKYGGKQRLTPGATRADGRYEDCLGDCGQGGLYCCDGGWDVSRPIPDSEFIPTPDEAARIKEHAEKVWEAAEHRPAATSTDVRAAIEKLVVALRGTPHYINASLVGPFTGDEPHADDCPGCAVTEALVSLQEVLDADA